MFIYSIVNPEPLTRKVSIKLLWILVLNILDGLLTYIAVTKGYAVEVNLLILPVVSDIGRLLAFKIFLPSLFILLVLLVINKYDCSKMAVARLFINICFGMYLFALAMHAAWIGTLVFTSLF